LDENGTPLMIRTMKNGKYHITAGTIDALVEALADNNQPGFFFSPLIQTTKLNPSHSYFPRFSLH